MVIVIYLAIILCSVTQSITTKMFNRRSERSAVFNAVKAASSLLLFALMAVGGFAYHTPTLLFGLAYGGCLCMSMYSGYKALSLGPMALTSMLVSFSVVIPLVWGLVIGNETPKTLHLPALLLLALAIFFTNADKIKKKSTDTDANAKRKERTDVSWLLFVLVTFLCNGICSVIQKQHQVFYPDSYTGEFMFFAMLFCTVIFSSVLLIKNSPSSIIRAKGKWLGALSGVANGAANFLTLALAGYENASILFPIISAGTLLAAILSGWLFFSERLKPNHCIALFCGLLSVILLKI